MHKVAASLETDSAQYVNTATSEFIPVTCGPLLINPVAVINHHRTAVCKPLAWFHTFTLKFLNDSRNARFLWRHDWSILIGARIMVACSAVPASSAPA